MRKEDIAQLNEANLVLRHFVDLSARLLPFLDELQRKRFPTDEEQSYKERIMDVFRNYNFDTKTSEMLIGSNILELIKRSFDTISSRSYRLRPGQKNGTLSHFLREYNRLNDNWMKSAAN